ncbi:Ppx/GppA family phosphatase [Saccharibacter sp. 17.LH.SD]|uniref:Ppx/GppA phosphatase family protein n=1 Tax=Saccharibacter sp. 17.LH.SD TaxID=2689393 RepID=UPI0013712AAC|nr:Ppx/GppA family phosphatase [Saccharibacter sp. 17.LH.SD]MXV44230.1 Ppx/GppA family phosphatase [Saccharibacter sp. 17.LH.SD]
MPPHIRNVHSQKALPSFTRASSSAIYAAIDLGTTSCRLLVARYSHNKVHVLERCSRPVQLGEGLNHNGFLTEEAMSRTLATLKRYVQRLKRWPIAGIRAVTTEACRRAANAHDFIERARRETGLALRIISSREEAELALESCSPLLGVHPRFIDPWLPMAVVNGEGFLPNRALLFDIGGGSTELSWIRLDHASSRHYLIGTTSIKLGAASFAERFAHLPIQDAYKAAFQQATQTLRAFEDVHCIRRDIEKGNVRMIGTSGTVTTLASVALELGHYDRSLIDGLSLGRQTLVHALKKLYDMPLDLIARHPCIGRRRSSMVLFGCAIFDAIQSLWPTDRIMIADRGLRDGMVVRMAREQRRKTSRRHRRPSSSYLPPGAFAVPS